MGKLHSKAVQKVDADINFPNGRRLQMNSEAVENHEKSLQIYQEIDDKTGVAGCYSNLGNVYDNMGMHSKAVENHEKSLQIYQEIDDKTGVHGDQKDYLCKELIPLVENMTISNQHATEKSKEIAARLGLDKHSVQAPPDEIRQQSRACYKFLLAKREYGCIEALKNELPCGMTGPLEPGILVKDMDSRKRGTLSKVLTVHEMEWKAFAKEQVGLSIEHIEFLRYTEKNPVLEILNKYCSDWTLDYLYNALVHSGSSAIADQYL